MVALEINPSERLFNNPPVISHIDLKDDYSTYFPKSKSPLELILIFIVIYPVLCPVPNTANVALGQYLAQGSFVLLTWYLREKNYWVPT